IWCFVFVTLFNLQGAHRSQRREFILPHRFRLVKNFFQVFQPFLFSRTPRRATPYLLAASAGDSLIVALLSRSVKNFFQEFFVPFSFPHSEP
ncbi:MAG: hypothetical protein ACOX7A_09570, partial [Lawsonibacter sp.]